MIKITNSLTSQLQQLGHNHATLTSENGGRLVILEKGARALEMIPAEENDSAFWRDPDSLSSENSWNLGGDRTWLGPELEFFIDRSGSYQVPAQLDPGNWKLTKTSSSQAITKMTCDLQHSTSSKKITIELEKRFTLLPNPLSMNMSSLLLDNSSLSYMGYEVRTDMNLTPANPNSTTVDVTTSTSGYCNLWSIMQVPPGGSILAPTYGSIRPLTMFSQAEHVEMKLLQSGLQLPCKGKKSFKLSIDALSSTGRFGYLRHINEKKSSLIIRQFSVNPSGIYPDYPPNQKDYQGSCMQFYFDGDQMGHFAELEYHSPALSIDTPSRMADSSQVFYFVGYREEIEAVTVAMLGIQHVEDTFV